jgi:hypothetical protein
MTLRINLPRNLIGIRHFCVVCGQIQIHYQSICKLLPIQRLLLRPHSSSGLSLERYFIVATHHSPSERMFSTDSERQFWR